MQMLNYLISVSGKIADFRYIFPYRVTFSLTRYEQFILTYGADIDAESKLKIYQMIIIK